jgi:hypothetical protein
MFTIGLFILKFLAVGAVGLFFLEDLELVKSISPATYNTYALLAGGAFISLFLFALGKKLLWLIVFLVCGGIYAGMYNGVEEIKAVHEKNDIQSRYFKDTATFTNRMADVWQYINKK